MTEGFGETELFVLVCAAGGEHFEDGGEGGFRCVGAVSGTCGTDGEGLFERVVFLGEEFVGNEVV